jgi:hypothetical protein
VAVPAELRVEVMRWGERSGHAGMSPSVLYLGLALWTRLHGLISLELGQHLRATGVSGLLLFDAELDQFLAQASGPPMQK